jgi:hypothetical protein
MLFSPDSVQNFSTTSRKRKAFCQGKEKKLPHQEKTSSSGKCGTLLTELNNCVFKNGCKIKLFIVNYYLNPIINQGGIMPTAVKISNELFEKAKIQSKVFKRSIAGQIEYWAKIGQIIEENPDLPLPFIQDVLIGKEQIKAGQGTPYVFG